MNSAVKIKIPLMIVMSVFLISGIGWALSVPLPPETKIIREETAEAGGENKQVTFCSSSLNKEKISSFYRKELEKRGYSIFLQQPQLLVYSKGDNLFLVMLGEGSGSGQKTSIVLTESKMGGFGRKPEDQICEDIPYVPVYPGAQCSGSIRLKSSKSISSRYLASAEVSDIRGFYLLNLQQAGWAIEQEKDAGKFMSPQALPNTGSGISESIKKSIIITFRGLKNERLTVALMPSFIGSGTMINIVYEEAK
jgi:hypothetical protein